MLTEFGKAVRKARIDVGTSMGQLADAANKTVSLEGLDTEMQFLVSGFARSTLTEEQIGRLKQMLDEAEAKEAYGRNGKK